jgi:hypothetical protein
MGAVDGCGCASVGTGWLLAAKGWIVLPLESIAETQPKLQPVLLRLSAIISQYFT